MQLRPGTRLRSTTDSTEVVVVRAPADSIDVRCGGSPMTSIDDESVGTLPIQSGFDGGTQLGKRYGGSDAGVELLCTKAGDGSLSIGDELLALKGSKPLPSSD
jgi:hypothetical protein